MAYIDLDGEWLLKGYPAGTVSADHILRETGAEDGWLAAHVPGEVHLDLMRNGVIEDPFYREHESTTQWVHEQDWWYRRAFTVDPELLDEDRVELVCEGLDTFALIFLNGQPVGNADNMLRRFRFDARPFLRGGDNEIVIGFHAPQAACLELAEQFGAKPGGYNFRQITQARKAQYSCGWDWGPFLTTVGIWQSLRVESWSNARVRDLFVRTVSLTDELAVVAVDVNTDALAEFPVTIHVGIAPLVGAVEQTGGVDITLRPGMNTATVTLEIPRPRRWWPVGAGEQAQYRAVAQVDGVGITLYAETTFGLRTVELIREPDGEDETFIIAVNGTPIFCRGANWIPGDQFLPRVSEAYYRKNLELARDAGMNMIRVWGGGIYETATFYRLCNEMGLMVWQDFLFACGSYPEYDTFRDNVAEEASQAIRALRNHPSLVLWCGNNENHWLFPKDAGYTGYHYYDALLPRLCAELDPTRPYWNGSPYSRDGEPANSPHSGDRHVWDLGDWGYLLDASQFVSEFGLQAPATRATMESVTLPEDRVPWSAVVEAHEKLPGRHSRQYAQTSLFAPVSSKFEYWMYGMHVNQCLNLRLAITHWRSRKWHTAGVLFWQLNDCWPVISWSVVDYQCRPKPSWYEVRRLYQPLLLTIQPVTPEGTTLNEFYLGNLWPRLDRALWLVNDTMRLARGAVRLRVMDFLGGVSWEREVPVEVEPNGTALPLRVSMDELGVTDPRRQALVAEFIAEDGDVISRDVQWLAEPKYLELPAQPLSYRQEDRAVTITARDLALYVEVDAGEGIPSDHFFHMLPGEARTVMIDGPAHDVAVRSFVDLLREG